MLISKTSVNGFPPKFRFASKDQRLACYCGFPRCRGVVNDAESVEREKGIYVPRSELKDWEGE